MFGGKDADDAAKRMVRHLPKNILDKLETSWDFSLPDEKDRFTDLMPRVRALLSEEDLKPPLQR